MEVTEESLRRSRYLTLEERKTIEKGVKLNYSSREISRQIKRSTNCVISELRLNGRETYNAENAHNEALKRLTEGRKKISNYNKKLNFHFQERNIFSRITSLEMQLEILIEEIRKLHEAKD